MKKVALSVLIMGVVLVSSAVGQEFTDVTVGSADPGGTVVTEGVYEVTGNGNDIWDNADAFQYYYKELTGDGSMVARVVDDGEGSNAWAKGGVMIRQSLEPGSTHCYMCMTATDGNGASWQGRPVADAGSVNNDSPEPVEEPYWVKIERVGNDLSGFVSADGENWTQMGDTRTIVMEDPVLIGLAVTSHAAGELRTFTFDNVAVESALATSLATWEDAATAAAPTFLATDVADGVYDIGTYGGEMTYEFVVQSNPAEEQASMCLIGRRNFGDTEAGLKYEQWNNTGTYGATLFGVADYDYGVANDPGAITHLAFVASAEAATTDLYVNGAYQGTVEAAITLSGLVGIGYGAQAEDGSDFFDDFDGEIFGVAIYDHALSMGEIWLNADAYFQKGPSDITAAGDAVQGVPNDGDWPGAETPDLAIDDDVATKYLHFKGETEPTGFQVTPLLGSTLVTGLTLTTANDAVERDPIQFELYGSNESIDGPYELIASGDVVDFAGEAEWPRFTMNETEIAFENEVAYDHYQILFPAVRDPASANSMQIAEVELIGVPCLPRFTYEGDDLDDQWDHDNGSDAWDGTSPGEGNPGGAGAMVEDGVTFLRIQDTGDPRDYDMPDPSNRKVYLTHAICASLDGAHLEVGIRVATGAGLDDQHPDGGAGISPWPEAGIGYHIRDGGKGMIGISDGSQIISFSLAKAGEIADVETDALVMNNLAGTEPSGDADTGAAAGVANALAIADATAWNNIVIDIVAGGAGTHVVTVSVNGDPAQSFDVTAGDGTEEDSAYVTIGSSGTGGITAFDVDYLSVTN